MRRAALSGLDLARRLQGLALERLGYGPQTTRSSRVRQLRAAELLAYAPRRSAPAVLIVPAPIKTPYIWDLAPDSSVVQRLLGAGLQVFLVAWRRPLPGDESLGLEDYAEHALGDGMEALRQETGEAGAFLAGHSLGGTLAAIYASLHPERVRGMIALEAPIAFGAGRFEAAAAAAPPAPAITRPLGNVPGSFLDMASAAADPLTFHGEPFADWLRSSVSPEARRLHWRVRRWTLDESPMARRLFEEVDEALYRGNRFTRGELRVAGRRADPRAIRAPIVAVLDRRSRIIPPASIEAYRTHTRSKDVEILEYPGDTGVVMQHVGVLVGPNAHAHLWPRLCAWLKSRS